MVPNATAQEEYNPWALRYLKQSIEALAAGDYDEVITQSNLVLRIDPSSSVSYTIRARAYFEKGDIENCIADCNQAIRFDRNNLNAYSLRASAHARTGSLDRAISDWQAVLRIDPENEVAQNNIALATKNN
ncbi:MAG: tetratricopeptide repeat protein [Treponema sp.]|nr:tetratricopeptide repeat protein [Treponema sp.]